MKKNSFIKSLNAMKSKLSKNKRLEESKNAAYLHLNVAPVKPKKSFEDIACRIFVGIIFTAFATPLWFGLTFGNFVKTDSGMLFKIFIVGLFLLGLGITEFFLILYLIKSKGVWKFDTQAERKRQSDSQRWNTTHVKTQQSDWRTSPSYSHLSGNRYHH